MGSSRARAAVDPEVRAAIARSNLRNVPPAVIDELTTDAERVRAPAASTFHREGDVVPHFELLLTGFARVYVTAQDGRTMTVRYCRPGAILGAVSLYAARFSLPASIQALVDSELLALQPTIVHGLVGRNADVAHAVLAELSERVLAFIEEIPGGAFATVRQRLARHLLDLASDRQVGAELFAPVTQQELADAGGTVREVVVRVLRDLRSAGVVRTRRDGILVLDPERLLAETYGQAEPLIRREWNLSR